MDKNSIVAAAYDGGDAWGLWSWLGAIAMTAVSAALVGAAVGCWMAAARRRDPDLKTVGYVIAGIAAVTHVGTAGAIVWQSDDSGWSAGWIALVVSAMTLAALAAVSGPDAPDGQGIGIGGGAVSVEMRVGLVVGTAAVAGVISGALLMILDLMSSVLGYLPGH